MIAGVLTGLVVLLVVCAIEYATRPRRPTKSAAGSVLLSDLFFTPIGSLGPELGPPAPDSPRATPTRTGRLIDLVESDDA